MKGNKNINTISPPAPASLVSFDKKPMIDNTNTKMMAIIVKKNPIRFKTTSGSIKDGLFC